MITHSRLLNKLICVPNVFSPYIGICIPKVDCGQFHVVTPLNISDAIQPFFARKMLTKVKAGNEETQE